MRKIKRAKDETPEEFFASVIIPAEWKFVGTSSKASIGRIYQLKPGVVVRLWFCPITKRGGIARRTDDWPNKPKYECLTSNKQAPGINEFLEHYNYNNDDEETNTTPIRGH